MNGIELQDREFFAAIREGREPNASVAQVLPCYRVPARAAAREECVRCGMAASGAFNVSARGRRLDEPQRRPERLPALARIGARVNRSAEWLLRCSEKRPTPD